MKDLIDKTLSFIPAYLTDLAGLISAPKRFAAKYNKSDDWYLRKGLTFLGISIAISFALTFPTLPGGRDFWTGLAGFGILVTANVIAFSAVLYISWRVVGGKVELKRFVITYSYFFAVGLLITVGARLVYFGAIRLLAPDHIVLVAGDFRERIIASQDAFSTNIPLLYWSLAFYGVLLISLAVWSIAGWGAYRELNQLSRLRSCIAFIVALLLSIPVAALLLLGGIALE